jgi:hypothetical protein
MMPGVSRIEGEVRWAEEDRRMRERASFVRYDLTVGDFPESVREILRGGHVTRIWIDDELVYSTRPEDEE